MKEDIRAILHQVADAFLPGDVEFEKILNAIALAESNGDPNAVGDGGWSIGLFQNHMRDGRGIGYTEEQLKNPKINAALAAKELMIYYLRGKQQGLSGANLATYVSKYGQRPAPGNEVHAGKNYGRMVGESATSTNEAHMMQKQEQPSQPRQGGFQIPNIQIPNLVAKAYASESTSPPLVPAQNFTPAPATIPMSSATNPAAQNYQPGNQYIVKPNDTLWGIAQQQLGNGNRWRELQGYSGSPQQLPVGQKITIPTSSQQQQNYSPVPKAPARVMAGSPTFNQGSTRNMA